MSYRADVWYTCTVFCPDSKTVIKTDIECIVLIIINSKVDKKHDKCYFFDTLASYCDQWG